MNGQPPVQHVGRLRLPRMDKTFGGGGGAKWKGRKEGFLAFLTQGPAVGIQVGHECVLLGADDRAEFDRLYSEADQQADAWGEPPSEGTN